MADSKVLTLSRLARWRIDDFGHSSTYRKSDSFKMGKWNWHLSVEKNRTLCVRLFPRLSSIWNRQPQPFARFVLRILIPGPAKKLFTSQVSEKQFRRAQDIYCWPVECGFTYFIIDVEFLDLKICPLNDGGATLLGPEDGSETMQYIAMQTLGCLSRMFEKAIHFDVTINTSDGSLRAHKAILSSYSPVFESMFHHNLKEKESSTINIKDMSAESCMALLSYLYGSIKQEDFLKHRLTLLKAANKYLIIDLKDTCEESLLEDIGSNNVLERLQEAWLYQLDKLKKGCLTFLFEFGKVYDIREDLDNFFLQADRKLMLEMFQEVLTLWKAI